MRCMGGCEVMDKPSYSIYFPTDEQLQIAVNKLNACKRLREQVSQSVLGHEVVETDWILFDEMLTMEYNRMQSLLKVLEERAG